MRISILVIAIVGVCLASCGAENKHVINSFELPINQCPYDTINMVIDGLKQGVWINHSSHDTTVYLNDTAHSVIPPMTASEIIQHLRNEGN